VNPATALEFAKADITVLTPQSEWGAKLKYASDQQEIIDMNKDMVLKGYTPVGVNTGQAGLTSITVGGKTLNYKAPVEKSGRGGGSSNQLSPTELANLKEQYPNAGLVYGDTESSAAIKIQAGNSPDAEARTIIQNAKDRGATLNEVINDLGDDSDAIAIAEEIYGQTPTQIVEKPKYAPIEDSIGMPSGNTRPADAWDEGFFSGIYDVLFN
jgi:hypothetical protein